MIYITGDTHIPVGIGKLSSKKFPEQKQMTGEDYLIICGDFGGVWCGDNEELYWRKWLNEKNFTTLFIDGNHENFDLLENFETIDFCGGFARKISDRIFHLTRGQIYNIAGKKIFTFGGASSHDKAVRTVGRNWWEREMPSQEEYSLAKQNLAKNNFEVDYIITHCAPTSLQNIVASNYETNELTRFLQYLKDNVLYKHWFFGHYHQDINIDLKHTAIFNCVTKAENL